MARQLRFDPAGGLHHVMHRGSRRQKIFEDDQDRHRFLVRLREGIERHDALVHSFALMPNHYHLLMEFPEGGISACMKHVNASYAQDFNWRHGYDGHLFRGRFHSLLIGDDAYFVEVVRYIHRNSSVAGLHPEAIDDPWSSHRSYLDGSKPDWLTTDRVLNYFGGDRPRFAAFVDAPDSGAARAVVEAVHRRRPAVGSRDFLEDLVSKEPERDRLAVRRVVPADLRSVAAHAERLIPTGAVEGCRAIDLALVAGRRAGCSSIELASFFDLPSATAVRSRVCRLERHARRTPAFEALISQICACNV